jgi:hypothetical protein
MCHERADSFLPRPFFYFFLKSVFEIEESEHKLGPIAFLQGGPQLRDDPVSHFRLQAHLARTWSNDVDAILTRIAANFWTSKRDVVQNGI